MPPKTYAQRFAQKGGFARARKLTAERRQEIARKAAYARWGKLPLLPAQQRESQVWPRPKGPRGFQQRGRR